jgi:hypothetical protein
MEVKIDYLLKETVLYTISYLCLVPFYIYLFYLFLILRIFYNLFIKFDFIKLSNIYIYQEQFNNFVILYDT